MRALAAQAVREQSLDGRSVSIGRCLLPEPTGLSTHILLSNLIANARGTAWRSCLKIEIAGRARKPAAGVLRARPRAGLDLHGPNNFSAAGRPSDRRARRAGWVSRSRRALLERHRTDLVEARRAGTTFLFTLRPQPPTQSPTKTVDDDEPRTPDAFRDARGLFMEQLARTCSGTRAS